MIKGYTYVAYYKIIKWFIYVIVIIDLVKKKQYNILGY